MKPVRDPALRVLGAGVLVGVLAGAAAGALDASWSWRAAAQFVPGVLGRLRFIAFTASLYAAAGAIAGLLVTLGLLVLSRASRIGDLLRFGIAQHVERRARDPRDALAGLAIAVAMLPCIGLALLVAFRFTGKFVANRKAPELVVVVSMVSALVAIAVAIPIAMVIARGLEAALARVVRRLPAIASPIAPLVAAGGIVATGLAAWAARSWETARVLPLRGPFVVIIALLVTPPLWRFARGAEVLITLLRRPARWITWILLVPVVFGFAVVTGSSSVTKAATAYTGLGGPIARAVRAGFDWDHDGYARILGGGDCDDGDASVHPGAAEIPDDGIDQNCVGGDPTATPPPSDPGFAAVPPSVPKDFNVLVITIDTTRADHLSTYGYARPTTPRLDELAKGGTVFEAGWAHAPSTRYSIPAILTGRYPLDVYYDTSVEGWPGLAPRATTLAEALGPLGFVTGAITNYWYFDRSRHMDQGFAEYDNTDASLHASVSGAGPEQTHGSSSKQQTDKAIAFVDKHADGRWMLWVHYYDPHYAYEPHPEIPSFGSDRMALYDGEIRFTDLHIGRLLDDLRAKGLYDKTVVVVTGDHGEGFGEHGVELHGYHLYAAQTKVPMIFRVPGLPPQRSQLAAGHVDIMPTLVNLAGASPTPDMMGHSLVSALAGAPPTDRVVFQQLSYEGNHEMRAGVTRDCHVIYNVSPEASWEVYRVDRDPMETHDLAGDEDACADTRRAVERWYDAEQVPAGAAQALLPSRPAVSTPLDLDLGTGVRLLGVDAPTTVKRGQQITLTWTFEARGAVRSGWKMFVHAEGPNKAMMINGDHRPTRPFEWWKAGQFVRYTTTIAIPPGAPDGAYTLWAGMFKGKERANARAPRVKIDNNAAAVATFTVGP